MSLHRWGVSTAALLASAAAAGAAATEPKAYAGICLGNCFECHSLLETFPRRRLEAAVTHTNPAMVTVEEAEAFFRAPEVCDISKLFPLSMDGEVYSLAAMTGGVDRLSFPGAAGLAHAVFERCSLLQDLSVDAFHAARQAAAGGEDADGPARAAAAELLKRLPAAAAPPLAAADRVSGARPDNDTLGLLEAYTGRAAASLQRAAAVEGRSTLLRLPLGEAAETGLAETASELARLARLLVEHARTAWALRGLLGDLQGVYPSIWRQAPAVLLHPQYGRHWDVLEWLLHGLAGGDETGAGDRPLRMVELGVACGPIGAHLLPRFPTLSYLGADPTIPSGAREAYKPYADRAQLFANTSEELHDSLPSEEMFDFVFIDGPHTYSNVRNDLEMFAPRVRPGGIIAGHDFTCAHPPLLWAVLEYRMNTGGRFVNAAMDGVWWWRVE